MDHWRAKLWKFLHKAREWQAPEGIVDKLYQAIEKHPHHQIDTKLYEAARLVARTANLSDLAQHHKEPKLSQLAEQRWIREVGSDL